jgi:hypothetical protein
MAALTLGDTHWIRVPSEFGTLNNAYRLRTGDFDLINGVDASYAVVEGDWGLGKGVQVQTTVYGGRYIDPVPNVGHYYPSAGHQPGYGRLEVEPPANRRLPQSGEIYYRSWSAQSAPPVAQPQVPFYPPPVIVAPQDGDGALQKFRPRSQNKIPH